MNPFKRRESLFDLDDNQPITTLAHHRTSQLSRHSVFSLRSSTSTRFFDFSRRASTVFQRLSLHPKKQKSISSSLQIRSKEMVSLERAVENSDHYAHLLANASNHVQTEFMLRLLRDLVHLESVDASDTVRRRALQAQIRTRFLEPDSVMKVDFLPTHLVDAATASSHQNDSSWEEPLLLYLLFTLVSIPEVMLCLVDLDDGNTIFNNNTAETSSVLSFEESAQLLSQLDESIRDSESRNKLLKELLGSNVKSRLMVKVRFVAAVNQFLACEDKVEQTKMEKDLRTIFLTKGMFFIGPQYPPKASLESIRETVLKDLSLDPEIRTALIVF